MPAVEHHFTHRSPLIRAAVLGANDGIISMSGVLMAVVSAGADQSQITLTTMSALIAGALSMGAGEYISVSSQLDSEKADILREQKALQDHPKDELNELIQNYQAKGLDHALATQVAKQLTNKNALKTHLQEELGLEEGDLSQPKTAAIISFSAFAIGGGIPGLLSILLRPEQITTWIYPLTLTCLGTLGYLSSKLGGVPPFKGTVRVLLMGIGVLILTQIIGQYI
ncbi:VIT family protein [Bacteriovoracaceae bacterium]|nr:VIT family protein [Bacteriovoracaceae bacterium]